ncbi:NAD-dependent epimerase/dehydratase family protein [Brevundimonas lenta]|uniref:Nucleoside-diphosphate-sugar epimerase n=1 Tax=Brevundimonas lenta TaxID=424796 RepID=A0A7W6NP79_9CAUL|nr:NAD(P)-dependent oxidoreductase [Brevundimonas lenta]MBB4082219.1 nucleoside-diphosphate-sugar epimerase [Brevundimonas lenta]
MRILVTGSSGFVGKALVRELAARGHHVSGFSRAQHERSFIGDLMDPVSLRAALSAFKPDVVFNLAAETDLKGMARNGYAVNTEGVKNLLDAVAASQSVHRVVWASSQLVCKPGVTPAHDTDYHPEGGYGESKVLGEKMVRSRDGAGKEWVIFRSTTIWGPGMSEHYAGILGMIRKGLYFHVGGRPLMKSYSYIDNLIDQLITLAIAPAEQVNRHTFYLADSDPIDLRAWAGGFGKWFHKPIATLPTPLARSLARTGDVLTKRGVRFPLTSQRLDNMLTEYVYDVAPIEAVHGRTLIGMEEGIERTARWYIEREDERPAPSTTH